MTVSVTTNAQSYSGDGANTSFPFAFRTHNASDVKAYKISSAGVLTTLTYLTDYTVALNGDDTGTVTYPVSGSALAVGETLRLVREVAYDQAVDLTIGGAYSPSAIEDALDDQTFQNQQLAEKLGRAVVVPQGEAALSELDDAASRAGKYLGFDAVTGAPAAIAGSGSATDSSMVTHTDSGSGAVTRTVKSRLEDFISVKDFGGTVTYSTIQDAFDGAEGRVLIHQSQSGDPTVDGVLSLPAGLTLLGGKCHGDNSLTQFFTWPSGSQSDNVSLLATDIEADAGIAVHHNARADGTLIALSRITADGYGLLSNSSSDNSTGFVALGNYIYSDKSDAIEWNHPDENSSDFIAIGNVLTASTNGSSVTSGFAVGVAGTQYHVTIGNIVKESRQEAFHIEDGQTGGIVIGNSAHGLQEDGIHILAPASGSGAGDGVIVHGNFLYHEGLQTGFYGVRCVGDSNGAQDLSLIGGNYVKGFDSGLRFGSVISSSAPQFFIADGNAADDCNVAVDVGKGSSVFGDNISDGCATLFKFNNRAKAGRVFSKSEPTTIVSYVGTTSEPGGMCRGFVFPVEITHSASPNSQSFDLFSMADLLSGRLAIYLENGSNFFVYIADISWDGTTLTVTNPVSNNSGTVGSTTVINNSGALAVQFSTTSAITAKDVIVDFDGYYYKT